MSQVLVFVAFWMVVIGVGTWMVSEEMADRKRERIFFRRLNAERQRLAERYGARN
jgi:hypothetical protein